MKRRSSNIRTGLWLAWLSVLVGCSAPALPPDYYEGQRLERAGRYAAAQQRYAKAARRCRKKRPDCAQTAFRAALMYLRMKQLRNAAAAFLQVARGIGRGLRVGARALTRAAEVLDALGEGARAERLWWEVIDRYPQQLAADDALRRLILRYRDGKRLRALLGKMRLRYRKLARTDIADNLLFEAAQIHEKDLDQPGQAAALYLDLARAHPKSPLFDDSLFLAGNIRRKQKRYRDAILVYKKLLATREDAMGGASYLSEWMDDSQLAIAQIWLMGLGKPKRAGREFREVISSFPSSVLRDDAQFWIVLCEVERGREPEARRAYAELIRKYPDSRYRDDGPALTGWIAFRRAARAKRTAEACRQWAKLRRAQPRSWLVRHGPHLPPWPKCARTSFSSAPNGKQSGRST